MYHLLIQRPNKRIQSFPQAGRNKFILLSQVKTRQDKLKTRQDKSVHTIQPWRLAPIAALLYTCGERKEKKRPKKDQKIASPNTKHRLVAPSHDLTFTSPHLSLPYYTISPTIFDLDTYHMTFSLIPSVKFSFPFSVFYFSFSNSLKSHAHLS